MQKYLNHKYFKLLISISLLGLFVWYVVKNWHDLSSLINISAPILTGILVVNILRIQNNANFLRFSLQPLNKHISYLESFYVALITAIGNFFGPLMGGVGVRSVYLKKKHDVAHADHAATLSGFYVITFITSSFLGLLALATIYVQDNKSSLIVTLAFAGWLIFSLALARIRSITKISESAKTRFPIIYPLLNKINDVLLGWRTIKSDKKLILRLFWLALAGFLIQYLIFYLEFMAIDVSPSLASLGLYVALSTFSLLVSITPGAIGIREAMFVFTNGLLGITIDQIFAVAIIDRSTTFIILGLAYCAVKTPIFRRYSASQK